MTAPPYDLWPTCTYVAPTVSEICGHRGTGRYPGPGARKDAWVNAGHAVCACHQGVQWDRNYFPCTVTPHEAGPLAAPTVTDTEVVDWAAQWLGSRPEWDDLPEFTERLAELITATGRPAPGDPANLANYGWLDDDVVDVVLDEPFITVNLTD